MPPAFNLSQDQTLQFSLFQPLTRPILLDGIFSSKMLVAISRTLQRRQSTHTSYLNELLKICHQTHRTARRSSQILQHPAVLSTIPANAPSHERYASFAASRSFYIISASCQTLFFSILPARSVCSFRFSLASRPFYNSAGERQDFFRIEVQPAPWRPCAFPPGRYAPRQPDTSDADPLRGHHRS